MAQNNQEDITMGENSPNEQKEEKKFKTEDLLRMSISDTFVPQENEPNPAEVKASLLSDIKTNVNFCKKSAETKEVRFILRALRRSSLLRKKITKQVLIEVIESNFPENHPQRESLLQFLSKVPEDEVEMVDVSDSQSGSKSPSVAKDSNELIPEAEIYLSLLVLISLIDKKLYNLALDCSVELVNRLKDSVMAIRNLDPLRAKIYFYYSRAFELSNRLSDIRAELLAAYRTATLRHEPITQAVVLNLLLRNYLAYNLYDQADKLVSKIKEFKEPSSNQFARYLYYTGRIKAVQLDYTEAYSCLSQAIRKAPQYSALGFRIIVQQLLVIVELLMGEIPQRSTFRQPGMKQALEPYFQLTMAVRVGDLTQFHETVSKYREDFERANNFSLIQRLRLTVIKTGLKKINVAYSRIALEDVCKKLHLESVENTEFIVAKAIRDRVIDAIIDHNSGYLQSRESVDLYSSEEPLEAFHKRISFCLNTHNDAVMAMRFPADLQKPQETEEEKKERLKLEQELEEMVDEEDDEDY